MTARWYVLRSKPNKETLLCEQLMARQIDVYYPCVRVQTVNPRARKMRPYFPGYLFVHVDLAEVGESVLRWTPGAQNLVSFGGEPASVPEHLLGAIRRRVEAINAAGGEMLDGLRRGERVLIQEGPFAGYEALFDARLPGRERVRVLLALLSGQQVPVELPAGQLRRLKKQEPIPVR